MKKISINLDKILKDRKISTKKKSLHPLLRISIVSILIIMIIISSYGAFASYQLPTTSENTITKLSYEMSLNLK